MYNSFLSIVSVINVPSEVAIIQPFLNNLYPVLKQHFSDYEIILVNNAPGISLDDSIAPLNDELKHNIYLLNVSNKINRNHAVVAGLEPWQRLGGSTC